MTNPPGTTIKGGNRMKFEIAGIEYTVEEVNGLTDAEHFGYINFADSVIRIDANLSEDRKRQTLAHELATLFFTRPGSRTTTRSSQAVSAGCFICSCGTTISGTSVTMY